MRFALCVQSRRLFPPHLSFLLLHRNIPTPVLSIGVHNYPVNDEIDQGLQPLEGGLEGETWTKGLESLAASCTEYFKAGAK